MNDRQTRHGDWMQTSTGKKFWPLDPRPEEVFIEDIAQALSKICRFGGHCKAFYSVAQHSCHVSDIVCGDRDVRRWGLLHDAAEAYVGDMIKPLKRFVNGFSGIESKILSAISARFGLCKKAPEAVEIADEKMLNAEALAVMGDSSHTKEWAHAECAASIHIKPWTSSHAYREFIERFAVLFPEESI